MFCYQYCQNEIVHAQMVPKWGQKKKNSTGTLPEFCFHQVLTIDIFKITD